MCMVRPIGYFVFLFQTTTTKTFILTSTTLRNGWDVKNSWELSWLLRKKGYHTDVLIQPILATTWFASPQPCCGWFSFVASDSQIPNYHPRPHCQMLFNLAMLSTKKRFAGGVGASQWTTRPPLLAGWCTVTLTTPTSVDRNCWTCPRIALNLSTIFICLCSSLFSPADIS